ncbi:MAG: hypothetical protein V3S29_13915 [bacterium]
MSAYDDAFHVLQDSRWLRFKRDLRLIRWLAKFLVLYLTKGLLLRRQYRQSRRRGGTIYID